MLFLSQRAYCSGDREMELFLIALEEIFILFIIIVAGYVCRRLGILSGDSRKQLTSLVIDLVLPCVVLQSFLSEDSASFSSLIPSASLQLFLIYAVSIALSYILIRKRSVDSGIERLIVIFSNSGFVGIPLLSAVYGELGKFAAIMAIIIFSLFFWTYGVYNVARQHDLRSSVKKMITPPLVAVIIALPLSLLSIRLPGFIMEPVAMIADMNSPLAMIVTGITVAEVDLSELFSRRVYYTVFCKNIVLPLILGALFFVVGLRDELSISLLVTAACPTAALVPMLALQYDHDGGLPSGAFAMSTALSMLTLPAYIYLLSAMASL